ncbi:hypothetical protein [Burkholderia sp. LMG 21824]|uniref:hypothetical protein n=1 Tax=Burkholderia sp. LMG 21824 TaxID=3158172 RepID=UPI003C2B8C87
MSAVAAKPVLAIAVAAILLGYYRAQYIISQYLIGGAGVYAHFSQFSRILNSIVLAVVACVWVFVMRYTVSSKSEARLRSIFNRGLWGFIKLSVVVGFGILLISGIVAVLITFGIVRYGSGWSRAQIISASCVLIVLILLVLFYLMARVSLLYCQAALERKMLWRAGWHDTSGHVGSILITHFIAGLPNLCLMFVGYVGAWMLAKRGFVGVTYLRLAIETLTMFVGTYVGAACSGWLYRRYANELLISSGSGGVTRTDGDFVRREPE